MADKDRIRTRRASLADADVVFELHRTSAVAGFAHIFPPDLYPFPDEAERATWAETLRSSEQSVVVAERNGRPVGVAVIGSEELFRFFVLPDEWGTGTADAFHDAVVDLVRSRGDRVCRLWVLDENDRARRFYERRGWQLDGRTRKARFPPFPEVVGYTLRIAA